MKITIIRSNRRTLALEITRTGEVVVRAPMRMSETDIRRFVEEKSSWLRKHLRKREYEKRRLQDNGKYTDEEIKKMIRLAKQVIPVKVAYYARIMGVKYGQISIRRQKTRWGSCSREGNLNFNCLLVMAPEAVLDYVVVHELSHRLEMNHSERFYSHVLRVCPEYRKWNKWLKDNGNEIMMRCLNN